MIDLVGRIAELDEHLTAHDVPYAFGGALALAWCTQQARGTIDIDVNIFLPVDALDRVVEALPDGIEVTTTARRQIESDGQARLWWERVPVDVFFDTSEFHVQVANRVRYEQFAGRSVPFLGCTDLAVFKAFFDRPKDWVDLAEMHANGSLDIARVAGELAVYLGAGDPRIDRLLALGHDGDRS